MSRISILITLLILCLQVGVHAENEEPRGQVVRGRVVDKLTQMPLPGANVMLQNSVPLMITATTEDGEFRLNNVPFGRQSVLISFVGYHSNLINNLIVTSGRETVLYVELEEKVETTGEVLVTANMRKDLALNQMASVSARTFTVEEAGRYAGSREDVARMAMNYAGVSGSNDQRNDIIIRGNTPAGILWRLEGVDIPNPNHFAAAGTTGGPIGMLNNNTLRNSDFFTGAFPAEYANVYSGVFDLNMREGNNEKYEFLGQAGFNGFELGAEGPLKRGSKSSFLVNYRYSTLQVFELLGISFGTSGIPQYQDLNFKVNIPVRKGRISMFGLGGSSSISMEHNDEAEELYTSEGMNVVNGSNSLAAGIHYSRFHNDNTYSRFILSYVIQNGYTNLDKFDPGEVQEPYYRENNTEGKLAFRYIFNKKVSQRLSSRSGFTIENQGYVLDAKIDEDGLGWKYYLDSRKGITNGPVLLNAFTHLTVKFSDRFEIKPGISYLHFSLNGSSSIEPRFGASWRTGEKTSLNLGYGKHSKAQPLTAYFMETVYSDGTVVLDNKDLEFTKAHHGVLGFDVLLTRQLRIKAEGYYQYLFDVPVESKASSYSMVNAGTGWGLNTRNGLVNEGEAWNYGIEFTIEKFYHKNYYFLTTLSLFDSKYTGGDGVKRNTAFNGNFVFNLLGGKEFILNDKTTFIADMKVTWAGGKRYSPIDVEASGNTNDAFGTEYFDHLAYSEQFPDYLKADVKIGMRRDGRKVSQLWEFYIENVTGHKNPLHQLYSHEKGQVETVYQLGFFPLFNYRIYF